MPIAVPYIRFSSEQQRHGSSLERQEALVLKWLAHNPDFTRYEQKFEDLGLSGFHGHHVTEGAMGRLLDAIEKGHIPADSVVLVEAMDRFSRLEPMQTLKNLESIVKTGIQLVTLEDGQRYDAQSLKNQSLMYLAMKAQVAHEFSQRLSNFTTGSYVDRAKEAKRGGTIKRRNPFWLTSEGKLREGDSVQVIRQAFLSFANGAPLRLIANRHPEHFKNRQSLKHALKNIAAIGHWQRTKTVREAGKSRQEPGELIRDVFEPAVTEELFYQVQKLLADLNQQHGNKPVNTWAGASIPKADRKRRWDITSGMTLDQRLQKLADFLGDELDTFLDELDEMPQRTARLRLARSIYKRQGDDLYEPLDRRYTLSDLQALKMEQLQALETIQEGSEKSKDFIFSNCVPDSKLGVLHDELKRFSADLPEGKHRGNCRFMLSLVRLLGIYLAQIGDSEGKSRNRFLSLTNAAWMPLQYCHPVSPWKTPASVLESDRESLVKAVTEAAHNALQGLSIDGEALEARLEERLHLQSLVPVVLVPNEVSWEASGANWITYIDNLYSSFESTWQALLDLGICTESQWFAAQDGVLLSLQAAIEQGREQHMNQRCFTHYNKPFQRYPAYLEFPPIAPEEPYPLAA